MQDFNFSSQTSEEFNLITVCIYKIKYFCADENILSTTNNFLKTQRKHENSRENL